MFDFIKNRIQAAKAWWGGQKQQGDQVRDSLPTISREEARSQVRNFQMPKQEFRPIPIVEAAKQRSLKPITQQFKNPRQLAQNLTRAASDPMNYLGVGGRTRKVLSYDELMNTPESRAQIARFFKDSIDYERLMAEQARKRAAAIKFQQGFRRAHEGFDPNRLIANYISRFNK